jgi:hypothetical protein
MYHLELTPKSFELKYIQYVIIIISNAITRNTLLGNTENTISIKLDIFHVTVKAFAWFTNEIGALRVPTRIQGNLNFKQGLTIFSTKKMKRRANTLQRGTALPRIGAFHKNPPRQGGVCTSRDSHQEVSTSLDTRVCSDFVDIFRLIRASSEECRLL